jgi:hypothetical protein
MQENSQIVYVLTNPAMSGLVKIGKTTQSDVKERMKQLYGTGVPVPFDCAFACQVKDANEVEKALHFAFGNHRINPNREFFKIEPERVIAVLKLLQVHDVTEEFEQKIESDIEAIDKQSSQTLKSERRPPLNFYDLSIPNGSILVSKDGTIQITVVEPKKVNINGVVCSLTAATRKLLSLADDYPIQPTPYWTFNGKTIKELYEDYHNGLQEE